MPDGAALIGSAASRPDKAKNAVIRQTCTQSTGKQRYEKPPDWQRAYSRARRVDGERAALAKTPPDQLIIGMNMNNLLTLDPAAMTERSGGIVVNLYDSLVELDPEQLTNVRPRWRNPGTSARMANADLSFARRREVFIPATR